MPAIQHHQHQQQVDPSSTPSAQSPAMGGGSGNIRAVSTPDDNRGTPIPTAPVPIVIIKTVDELIRDGCANSTRVKEMGKMYELYVSA